MSPKMELTDFTCVISAWKLTPNFRASGLRTFRRTRQDVLSVLWRYDNIRLVSRAFCTTAPCLKWSLGCAFKLFDLGRPNNDLRLALRMLCRVSLPRAPHVLPACPVGNKSNRLTAVHHGTEKPLPW